MHGQTYRAGEMILDPADGTRTAVVRLG
jgi:hypothetical protein